MIKNERGVALLLVILFSGLLVAGGAVILYGYNSSLIIQKQIRAKLTLNQISANIQSALLNDSSLKYTILNNAGLSCLQTAGGDCQSAAKSAIEVFLSNGSLVASSNQPGQGYDWNGKPCNDYSETTPSSNCVFKATITWGCENNNCELTRYSDIAGPNSVPIKPSVSFDIQMKMSAASSISRPNINTENFRKTFVRKDAAESLLSGCTKMGGILDASGRCSLSATTVECPPWSFLSRYDENGQIECQTMPMHNTRCPPGNAAIGYNPDGSFRCFMY